MNTHLEQWEPSNDPEVTWQEVRTAMHSCADALLAKKHVPRASWISNRTLALIAEKKMVPVYLCWLQCRKEGADMSSTNKTKKSEAKEHSVYRTAVNKCRKSVRQDKKDY